MRHGMPFAKTRSMLSCCTTGIWPHELLECCVSTLWARIRMLTLPKKKELALGQLGLL